MNDFISREVALKQLSEAESNGIVPLGHYEQRHSDFEEAKRCIEDVSATDVQPVKRGRWKFEHYNEFTECYEANCSECGYESTDKYKISESHQYCESCGAIMDGDTE